MDRGTSANMTILVTAPGNSGNITNTAVIVGAENDRDLLNNSATANTTMIAP